MNIERRHRMSVLAIIASAIIAAGSHACAQEIDVPITVGLPELITADVTPETSSVELAFDIAGVDSFTLRVIAPIDDAVFSLLNPSNVEVLASGDPGLDFLSGLELDDTGALPGGVFTTNDFKSPDEGQWNLVLTFPKPPENVVVYLQLFTESDFQVGMALVETRAIVGQPMAIGMLIINAGQPMLGLSPTIMIEPTDPAGDVVLITGLDDGEDADGLANDGIYSVNQTFTEAGSYEISGTVEIPSRGITRSRTATVVFIEVSEPSIEVFSITTAGIMPPPPYLGDCFESIEVVVTWSFIAIGEYQFRATLRGSNDNTILAGVTIERFSTGPGNIAIEFSADDIREIIEVDGPYTIEELEIIKLTEDDAALVFANGEEIETDAFVLEDLCRVALEIGNPADSTIGESLVVERVIVDGFIESLTLTIPIFVPTYGTFTTSFKLLGEDGSEAAIFADSQLLNEGANDVVFSLPGGAIVGDGPYTLTALLVTNSFASAQLAQLGDPIEGVQWQFLPNVTGDINNTDAVDVEDRTLLLEFRNQTALDPGDRRDLNRDGKIDLLDVRALVPLQCAQGACPENFE